MQETRWKCSKAKNIVVSHGMDRKRNGVRLVLNEENAKNVLEVNGVRQDHECEAGN